MDHREGVDQHFVLLAAAQENEPLQLAGVTSLQNRFGYTANATNQSKGLGQNSNVE